MSVNVGTRRTQLNTNSGNILYDSLPVSGALLWIDFSDNRSMFIDAGTNRVSKDGDLIYQVNDKSGNGYNGIQTTPTARPVYILNQKNGLSVNYSNCKNVVFSNTLRALLDKTVTVFMVANYSAFANDGFGTRYYSANNFSFYYRGNNKFTFNWGTNLLEEPIAKTNLDNYYIKAFKWNSPAQRVDIYSNSAISIGNAAPALNASLSGNSVDSLKLGALAGGLAQYYGELIVYGQALSEPDMSNVFSYLNTKWDIY